MRDVGTVQVRCGCCVAAPHLEVDAALVALEHVQAEDEIQRVRAAGGGDCREEY